MVNSPASIWEWEFEADLMGDSPRPTADPGMGLNLVNPWTVINIGSFLLVVLEG